MSVSTNTTITFGSSSLAPSSLLVFSPRVVRRAMEGSPSTHKFPEISQPFLILSFSSIRTGILELFKTPTQLTAKPYAKNSEAEAKPATTLQTTILSLANSVLKTISSTLVAGSCVISQMMECIWDGVFLANTTRSLSPLVLLTLYNQV
jgi:hypothetical protein